MGNTLIIIVLLEHYCGLPSKPSQGKAAGVLKGKKNKKGIKKKRRKEGEEERLIPLSH